MELSTTTPTLEQVKEFLTGYGWNFRDIESDDSKKAVITNYHLEDPTKDILISLHIEGEFLLVSTVDFLRSIPDSYSKQLILLNDKVKLVKLYAVSENEGALDIELGFELRNEAFNETTFYAFMDMLGMGIDVVVKAVEDDHIPHKTNFVTYY